MQASSFSFLFRGIVAMGAFCCLAATAHSAQLPDFTRIVEQNLASVATVSVKKKLPKRGEKPGEIAPLPEVPEDSKLKEFFGRFFEGQGGSRRMKAVGSGLVISSDGRLFTAAHLVKDATRITVRLEGNKDYPATLLGLDDPSDIALLKISASGLRVPRFGHSGKLKIGQWVLSIGAPFGFEKSASQGIISALNRKLSARNPVRFLQTDVAVNPGNSGGPLFNINGEVIGINSQIYSRSGGYQGVSFAVPIETALAIAKRFGGK